MDANGSRFHLLLGQSDWGACLRENADGTLTPLAEAWREQSAGKLAELGWDAKQQALMLPAKIFRLRDAPREGDLDPARRRGADADAHGHIYWLEDDGIHVQNAGDGKSGRWWPAEPGACKNHSSFRRKPESTAVLRSPLDSGFRRNDDASSIHGHGGFLALDTPANPDLRGLAVLSSGHLVTGLCNPPGLLVFDLHSGGAPRRLLWPSPPTGTPPFRPVDLAARSDGGLWVLDAGPNHCRMWSLNAQLDWLPLHDHAPTGEVFADFSLPLAANNPVALTATDDAAWILDNHLKHGACGLWRVSATKQERLETHALIDLLEDEAQAGFQLAGHDLLALPDGTLLLVSQDGNQAFAFQPSLRKEHWVLDALSEYRPLRRYTPLGLVLAKNRPSYPSQGHWIPLIEQARPRHETRFVALTPGEHAASLPVFDGGQPGCVWHRLFLDACVPPGCAFEIESRAAEHPAELALVPWRHEPDPYRRNKSELPWLPTLEKSNAGTWEALLQNARGRYLQLRLTLLGNGRATPRITALRAYYPRFSWLEHYLPAAWRRDPVSAAFVERWLANPEGVFTALEDRLAAVHCLFDARSVPVAMLDWLGSWFGLALTDGWSERRKRLLLRHADQIFRERGTPAGLMRALRLAVDPEEELGEHLFSGVPDGGPWGIRLIEHFLLGADAWPEEWDHDAYRVFLARRYGHIENLVKAWKMEANPPADFAQAATAEFPEGESSNDRALFARLIQPARRRAHRFSVLLPRQECDPALNDKVRQVLAREAPAHTVYEIAEYELALRVGSARLGVDSVLGARAGWTPLIIDQSHLGLSWLAPPPAEAGRWPADRYPITS